MKKLFLVMALVSAVGVANAAPPDHAQAKRDAAHAKAKGVRDKFATMYERGVSNPGKAECAAIARLAEGRRNAAEMELEVYADDAEMLQSLADEADREAEELSKKFPC